MESVETPVDLRVADADRAEAQRLLGEHMTAGRLAGEEYRERVVEASSARTRGEIAALFRDLPPPQPRYDLPATPPAPNSGPSRSPDVRAARESKPALALHTRYAAIAVTVPCAVFGAGTGLVFSAGQPAGLLLALIVVATLYTTLVLAGRRNRPPDERG